MKVDLDVDRMRVARGRRVDLRRIPTRGAPRGAGDDQKEAAQDLLAGAVERLREMQALLYAQDRWAVLLILQGMDAAGKDGIVKHVLGGLNPTATHVQCFKTPTAEELDHDYLWRTNRWLPERGRIGVFNRSYYEEVLIVRVEPAVLAGQKLPASLVTRRLWRERFEDIVAHERYLARNGTAIAKVYLHISRDEQRKRFLERLEDPEKNWKFSIADVDKAEQWSAYRKAYQDLLRETSRPHAPWYIVPADQKWFARLAVAEILTRTLAALELELPTLTPGQEQELEAARRRLESKRK
jgi:PPK2 family polyphosphate:nucleotide phosphotransferase